MSGHNLPEQWTGHCPACGTSGNLAQGRNQCSSCGTRFAIQSWGGK